MPRKTEDERLAIPESAQGDARKRAERDDKAIAEAAEIGNPKRLYFLKQEVRHLNSSKLVRSLSILLKLETSLKRGMDETATLQTAVIELCGQVNE